MNAATLQFILNILIIFQIAELRMRMVEMEKRMRT